MKLKRFFTGVLSAVMALSVCALPAAAAEDNATTGAATTTNTSTSTIDTTQKGKVIIHKYVMTDTDKATTTSNGEVTDKIPDGALAAPGAEFTLYKVMGIDDLISYYNGDLKAYTYTENGKEQTIDYTQKAPEASDFIDSNKKIKTSMVVDNVTNRTQKTQADGVATFTGLDLGLYVAIETKTPAAVTQAIAPFLISVPMTRIKEGTTTAPTEWLYEINVYPKNSTAIGAVTLKKMGVVGSDMKTATGVANVKFTLERLQDGEDINSPTATWTTVNKGNGEDNTYTTASNGEVTVNDLIPGTYRFTEVGYTTEKGERYIINQGTKYVFIVERDGDTVKLRKPADKAENTDYVVSDSVTGQNASVTVYNYAPDVKKQVENCTTKGKYQKGADYSVGDTINYKVDVTIPKNISELKIFTLTDTPTNLKDNVDNITIYTDAEMTTLLGSEAYTTAAGAGTNTNGFVINFKPEKLVDESGKAIEKLYVKYTATLLKTAVTTTVGNTNKIDLTYSNKIGLEDKDKDNDNNKNHIEDSAVVYTFKINIKKVNDQGESLKGEIVTFDLYKEVGPYANDTAATEAGALDRAKAKQLGFDTTKDYKLVKENLTVDENGEVSRSGLSNGNYWLVETKTEPGYNLLAKPVKVELSIAYKTSWSEMNEYENGVWVKHELTKKEEKFETDESKDEMNGGKENGEKGIGSKSIVVVNKKGFQLPVTGGFGTLLFSGIGVLLVLAGVAVLFSMKNKNDRA